MQAPPPHMCDLACDGSSRIPVAPQRLTAKENIRDSIISLVVVGPTWAEHARRARSKLNTDHNMEYCCKMACGEWVGPLQQTISDSLHDVDNLIRMGVECVHLDDADIVGQDDLCANIADLVVKLMSQRSTGVGFQASVASESHCISEGIAVMYR